MRIAVCQINPTVGDVDGNAERIVAWAWRAAGEGADLALFPEQVLGGYPAEDLLHKPHFLERCTRSIEGLAREVPLPCLVGWPEPVPGELDDHFEGTPEVWNSAAVLSGGKVAANYRKLHLPNYAVFDEKRYFRGGSLPMLVELDGVALGVTVCEDVWVPNHPVTLLAAAGARAVLNLSASPYRVGRGADRQRLLCTLAHQTGLPVVLCNQVGGQDELVFDGDSLVVDGTGLVVARGKQFAEEMLLVDVPLAPSRSRGPDNPVRRVQLDTSDTHLEQPDTSRFSISVSSGRDRTPMGEVEEVWHALATGLGDYVRKNGFGDVVLGVSGGIDSALVLALAAEALSPPRVHAVTMPSPHTSEETRSDAHALADNLGVSLLELPILDTMDAYTSALGAVFEGRELDVTEENLQARIRGNLLMALSNKFGWLVLTTGNKSEVSVGYMTLYGDMAGGFAPIKDVPKTLVYRLAEWCNERATAAGNEPVIPETIITRPPTAELRPDQLDTDSLPPYPELDPLLQLIVERDHGVEEAVRAGFDAELAMRVQKLVDRSEYKRRQAPPGIRVTAKAFGRDRRMPITNGFDGKAVGRFTAATAGGAAPR